MYKTWMLAEKHADWSLCVSVVLAASVVLNGRIVIVVLAGGTSMVLSDLPASPVDD